MVKEEAESLANQPKDYKFCVSLIFWNEVLFKVNYVSKELQGETKDINEGMQSFEKLLSWLRNYREEGFNDVLIGANELAESIELPPESKKFHKKKYVEGSECFYMRQMINLMMIQKKRRLQSLVLQLSPRSSYSVIRK